jgi:hypothetical protein
VWRERSLVAQRGAETVELNLFCMSHMRGSVALTLFSSPPGGERMRACVRGQRHERADGMVVDLEMFLELISWFSSGWLRTISVEGH